MDFNKASQLGVSLSKDYAEDFFKLLVNYQDISASEAASRLSLHIQTAQDFLENLADLKIVKKTEVFEKKRPYYRYTLNQTSIKIDLDLISSLPDKSHMHQHNYKHTGGIHSASLFNEKGEQLGKVPVAELENTLRTLDDVYAVVFDGKADYNIASSAKRRGVKFLICNEKEQVRIPISIFEKSEL